ncbi:MAG TPA: MFS transporter, partial [Chloroflexota bacterium]|nr:MFS transporter [Chloroflexota bacterium]
MTSTGTRPSALPGQEHPERLFTPNFLLASLLTFAAFASFYLLLATLPVYIIQIGGRESEVGLVIGSFSLTAILLRLYVGRAADQRGRKPFILVGTAVLVLCSGLYTLVRSVPALLALRMVHGAGWASFGTATNTLVADLAPRSRRGAAMGYFGMFSNLAMAVGPALGVWLMNGYGFDILFMVAAGTALLAFLMSLAVSEPAGRRQPPPAAQAGSSQGFIEHSALFPSLVLTLTTVTYGSIVSFLPIYAARQGVDNPGIFFTAYAVVLIVARGFTGHLSDRYGRAAVIAPGLLLAAAGLLVL